MTEEKVSKLKNGSIEIILLGEQRRKIWGKKKRKEKKTLTKPHGPVEWYQMVQYAYRTTWRREGTDADKYLK